MKRFFQLFIACILLLSFSSCSSANDTSSEQSLPVSEIQASYMRGFSSIGEMTCFSDKIAVVEITDDGTVQEGGSTVSTVFKAKVVDPIHKTEKGEPLEIGMFGGVKDGVRYVEPGVELFRKGEQWLVFLDDATTYYITLTGSQGRFRLDGQKATSVLYDTSKKSGLESLSDIPLDEVKDIVKQVTEALDGKTYDIMDDPEDIQIPDIIKDLK